MTPDDRSTGSDDDPQASEPVFSWGLTPTEPEKAAESEQSPDLTEPPATEALSAADLPTGLMDVSELPTGLMDVADLPSGNADSSDLPTQAISSADLPTAAINSADLPTAAMDAVTRRELRMPAAVDPALEGATEVLGAHPVSAAGPEDESVEHDAVGALFGEEQFVEYEEVSRGALVPVALSAPRVPQEPRPPIPRGQLIAISIAAGLVAALALAALFLAGTKIGDSLPPAAVATPVPTDTASAAPTVGPLPAGTYAWSALLGGECLEPFESAWQEEYTVIDCAQPHAAQLLMVGQFDDAVSAPFPEVDDLVARTTTSCSTDAVIDFAAAQSFVDLELVTSFAPNASDWDAGHRDYYCFATRSGSEALTESVAQPQTAAGEGE